MSTDTTPSQYTFAFDAQQWEEIESLALSPLGHDNHHGCRLVWVGVAQACFGKAHMIDTGWYGGEEDDDVDLGQWADELRAIAQKILDYFTPGDSKI